MAKKRKIDSNNLQVCTTESDKIPCKKRLVHVRKISSSKKWDVSVICESKSSIRRSKRLAAKTNSAGTDFNCSAVVSLSTVRRKDQIFSKLTFTNRGDKFKASDRVQMFQVSLICFINT